MSVVFVLDTPEGRMALAEYKRRIKARLAQEMLESDLARERPDRRLQFHKNKTEE